MEAQQLSPPRVVIAAPQGRSGKTTLSLGLCAAFTGRGLHVQPFKKGPDYIDASWLSAACSRPCRSLDPFFFAGAEPTPEEALTRAFLAGAGQAGLCLIEGNHGLYDSSLPDDDGDGGRGSTAAVARCLRAPVLLVVNARRMSRSAAAMVGGYQSFEPDTNIAGVILNHVAGAGSHSGRHEAKLRQAIERYCHIPVVGALPSDEALAIPDRHLGLVPRGEDERLIPAIEACQQAVERYVDLEAVLAIARSAPPVPVLVDNPQPHPPSQSLLTADGGVSIAVIRDQVFSFYYPENLEALQQAGAQLIFIDSLHTPELPSVDALYIGGGFPEIFLEQLSANVSLRQAIRGEIERGLPVYAECGGLMYLSQRIHWGSRTAEMVGALPVEIEMTGQPQGHGYMIAQVATDNCFLPAGAILRGHEFHHSRLASQNQGLPSAYRLIRGHGLGNGRDGLISGNILASYMHLHAAGSPAWAPGFVRWAMAKA